MALPDAIDALTTIIGCPPIAGTHRFVNHGIGRSFEVGELALRVQRVAQRRGLEPEIAWSQYDPRSEKVRPQPDYTVLLPQHVPLSQTPIDEVIERTLKTLEPFAHRVREPALSPASIQESETSRGARC